MNREIQRLITTLLYEKGQKFQSFIENLDKSKLSANHLGEIHNMIVSTRREVWSEFFDYRMSDKLVANKWRQGWAVNPGPGVARERPDVIMKYLLREDFPLQALDLASLDLRLPGGSQLSNKELAYFNDKFHREFLSQTLKIWRQKVREEN
ncbi:MAG: hypothetical protein LBT38_00530 [Deltaproteobacteria bacterium]|jgi:hypothetical protein|nr:hypothetical protein [Deltaproteobacteria bacterium]